MRKLCIAKGARRQAMWNRKFLRISSEIRVIFTSHIFRILRLVSDKLCPLSTAAQVVLSRILYSSASRLARAIISYRRFSNSALLKIPQIERGESHARPRKALATSYAPILLISFPKRRKCGREKGEKEKGRERIDGNSGRQRRGQGWLL